jgi:pimeloyl-ACP methyl ester carboxylesterase
LAQTELELFAPDLRGHGLTDKPEDDFSFDTYAKDLTAFIQTLDLRNPILIGHSWGATVVLDYAARFPFGPYAPAGIVLVDGGMVQLNAMPDATWEQVRDLLTPPRLAGTPLEDFLKYFNNPDLKWVPDEQSIQAILANFEISEDETIYPHLNFEHHMAIVRSMWEYPTYSRYELVQCPVLMVPAQPPEPKSQREADHLAQKKRGADFAQEKIKNVHIHWMADTVHDIPLHKPGELSKLIQDFAHDLP